MAGLQIRLAPGEQVVINGAVIENGSRRTEMCILSEGALIFRMRLALEPVERTKTPLHHAIYYLERVLRCETTFDGAEFGRLANTARTNGFITQSEVSDIIAACGAGEFYRVHKLLLEKK